VFYKNVFRNRASVRNGRNHSGIGGTDCLGGDERGRGVTLFSAKGWGVPLFSAREKIYVLVRLFLGTL
jgi:hypothetical protein